VPITDFKQRGIGWRGSEGQSPFTKQLPPSFEGEGVKGVRLII